MVKRDDPSQIFVLRNVHSFRTFSKNELSLLSFIAPDGSSSQRRVVPVLNLVVTVCIGGCKRKLPSRRSQSKSQRRSVSSRFPNVEYLPMSTAAVLYNNKNGIESRG